MKLTPMASTRTSACPGPGLGTSMVSRRSTPASPVWWMRMASMDSSRCRNLPGLPRAAKGAEARGSAPFADHSDERADRAPLRCFPARYRLTACPPSRLSGPRLRSPPHRHPPLRACVRRVLLVAALARGSPRLEAACPGARARRHVAHADAGGADVEPRQRGIARGARGAIERGKALGSRRTEVHAVPVEDPQRVGRARAGVHRHQRAAKAEALVEVAGVGLGNPEPHERADDAAGGGAAARSGPRRR